jgi:hypothetical protein
MYRQNIFFTVRGYKIHGLAVHPDRQCGFIVMLQASRKQHAGLNFRDKILSFGVAMMPTAVLLA